MAQTALLVTLTTAPLVLVGFEAVQMSGAATANGGNWTERITEN